MKSLFWKIFLWFWAAQILIGASLYLLALANQRGFEERLRGEIADNLETRARAYAVVYESGGEIALREFWSLRARAWRRGFGRRPSDRGGGQEARGGPEARGASALYAVGDSSHSSASFLIGRPLPAEAFPLVAQATQNGAATTISPDGGSWIARRIETPRGGRYVMIGRLRPPPATLGSLEWRGDILGLLARFLIIALTMGAVCYALARYLTGPTLMLQRATRQIAAGELSTRVGNQMGTRRDELADLGRDFDLMAERIESLMKSERRLLADISHELRSPLARMQLTLELAEEDASDKSREYLARMRRESERLNDLIGQLLTLTRLESATTQARLEPLDLAPLVSEVVADADFEARSQNRRVKITQSETCRVSGDAELLRRAVENVVRNAVRYTPENTEIEVVLRCESFGEESRERGASARAPGAPLESPASTRVAEKLGGESSEVAVITVRDFGSGVPQESLSRIFDPFYRVADARDRQSGGVGLGLSITARAVRLHGGQVNAKNLEDGGLLVEIRLPLAPSAAK